MHDLREDVTDFEMVSVEGIIAASMAASLEDDPVKRAAELQPVAEALSMQAQQYLKEQEPPLKQAQMVGHDLGVELGEKRGDA